MHRRGLGLLGLALVAVCLVGVLWLDWFQVKPKSNEVTTPSQASLAALDDTGGVQQLAHSNQSVSTPGSKTDRKVFANDDPPTQEGLPENLIDPSGRRTQTALPGRIVGRVLGPDGLPCSLFRAHLFSINANGKRHTLLSQRGRDGFFAFQDIKPGTYVVEVRFGNLIPDSIRVEVQSNATARSTSNELLFQLEEGARIQGRVLDPEGKPSGSALVLAFNPTTGTHKNLKAAKDGSFTLRRLEVYPWVLVAQTENYSDSKPVPVYVHSGRTRTEIELKLRPTCQVTGVVRLEDGAPAAGAQVTLCYDKASDPPLLDGTRLIRGGSTLFATANNRGAFALAPKTSGAYRLFAQLKEEAQGPEDDMDPIRLNRSAIQWGALECGESKQHEILLPGGVVVRVEGSLCFNGKPASYRRLQLGSLVEAKVWSSEVRSDKNGKFTLLLPSLEPFKVQIWPAKSSASDSFLQTGSRISVHFPQDASRVEFAYAPQTDRMDLDLALGGLRGQLKTLHGSSVKVLLRPVTQAEVSFEPASWATAWTSPSGGFNFGNVAEGLYRLSSESIHTKDNPSAAANQWTEVYVRGGEIIEGVEVPAPPK